MYLTYEKKTAQRIGLENRNKPIEVRRALLNEIGQRLEEAVHSYEIIENDSEVDGCYFIPLGDNERKAFLDKHFAQIKAMAGIKLDSEDSFEVAESTQENWTRKAFLYCISMYSLSGELIPNEVEPTSISLQDQAWEDIRFFEDTLREALQIHEREESPLPSILAELEQLNRINKNADGTFRVVKSLMDVLEFFDASGATYGKDFIMRYLRKKDGSQFTGSTIEQTIKTAKHG